MNFILPYKEAESLLREEIEKITNSGFFDYNQKEPKHSISKAIEERGIMLGLLVCQTKTGERVILKAFSGALYSFYNVPSYVPPCFSVNSLKEVVKRYDDEIHALTREIESGNLSLKKRRKEVCNACLEEIKELYTFYTIEGKLKLKDIPELEYTTGMGDCATIKLLSSCFKKGFYPISLAEIFFGKDSEEKCSSTLYPPCDERCSKLIKYLFNIDLIYSDEDIVVINKAPGLLSTPGKGEDKYDSASVRVHKLFPSSPENPSCHRLDMDTSGVMVFAKTEEAKRIISMQFEKRETKKVYVALLRGLLTSESGSIDLPIRLDVENRPYQIVDNTHGKAALTEYKRVRVEIKNNEKVTRVIFYPKTGRTHQIRVHAASGLNLPIVGDRLYGKRNPGERLCLHASSLTFFHPRTKEEITFQVDANF